MIEYVGKTARVMARKDLDITKIEQLKGLKVANQTGSSTGNIFVDQIAPKAGLKKGDYQEVRMNVDDMVAALAAKTVDAMANVEPYNAIAEADGLAVTVSEYSQFDKLPVFMAATPDFVQKSPETVVAYLKAWLEVANDFKSKPDKVADTVYSFFKFEGIQVVERHFCQGLGASGGAAGLADRPCTLHARAIRNSIEGKQDQGRARLEQGAAYRIPQTGKRLIPPMTC